MLNHRLVPHGHPVQVGQERGWIVGETCTGMPIVQFADKRKPGMKFGEHQTLTPVYDLRVVSPCFLEYVSVR